MILGKISVEFQHDAKRGTRCVVKEPSTKEVISTAWARLHTNDTFDRVIGRKISMTRAIKDFTRRERTAIWNDYHKTMMV